MSLSFARTDVTQTSQAERGCMVVLPLARGKRQQKLGLGDSEGVLQVHLETRARPYTLYTLTSCIPLPPNLNPKP
jgi:hypothetical protein